MQPKQEIEDSYKTPDPWQYQTTPDDVLRKNYLLGIVNLFGPYHRALDIGAGEGWITQDLPAKSIFGYEISDNAAARFPANVSRVLVPEGKYDLVIATGVMYGHYDWVGFLRILNEHSSRIIITSNIKPWEVNFPPSVVGTPVFEAEFPYREWQQKVRVWKK